MNKFEIHYDVCKGCPLAKQYCFFKGHNIPLKLCSCINCLVKAMCTNKHGCNFRNEPIRDYLRDRKKQIQLRVEDFTHEH